jgi:hypothetical protein
MLVISFKRSLGIFRNAVVSSHGMPTPLFVLCYGSILTDCLCFQVLPVGYALASSSINGEVMQLETGQVSSTSTS